jgi:hypothetical protein
MMRRHSLLLVALASLPVLCSAQDCGTANATLGVRSGTSFQIYAGKTPQIYRVCKREARAPNLDCQVEVSSDFGQRVVLEVQPQASCACADIEGSNIVVKVGTGGACSQTSSSILYKNVGER